MKELSSSSPSEEPDLSSPIYSPHHQATSGPSLIWLPPNPTKTALNKGNVLMETNAKSFLWAASYLTDLCNCLPFPHHLVWALLLTRAPLLFLLCLNFWNHFSLYPRPRLFSLPTHEILLK